MSSATCQFPFVEAIVFTRTSRRRGPLGCAPIPLPNPVALASTGQTVSTAGAGRLAGCVGFVVRMPLWALCPQKLRACAVLVAVSDILCVCSVLKIRRAIIRSYSIQMTDLHTGRPRTDKRLGDELMH